MLRIDKKYCFSHSTHYYHFTKQLWATCTVYNVLHGWSRGQKNEQQNNAPSPKKQCSCRLLGSSENRAFETCRSTEQLNSQDPKFGSYVFVTIISEWMSWHLSRHHYWSLSRETCSKEESKRYPQAVRQHPESSLLYRRMTTKSGKRKQTGLEKAKGVQCF